ncbi:hypothetical protein AURDEDRAFT_175791 [Auricularia subglabra TFB-10046 SS5]|uniref:MYND-type domain-containing protein n=1 Tax=Auricularia subglabra (strain TFB-10046 / SS5) TaxID=717982 RepID=J0D7P7_AURST|nr:hypothetical protein AURDEDRAFT_175791 [Auricularia subglabra TFB-10046 SS5]
MALLARAFALAPKLRALAACTGCIHALADDLAQADAAVVDELRSRCAELWAACVGVLSRATGELDGLSACVVHAFNGTTATLVDAVCGILHVCLSVGDKAAVARAERKHAVFGKRGTWPVETADLFPSGAAVYVRFETPVQMRLLGDVLFVAHALVFPAVLRENDVLVGALVRRLNTAGDPESLHAALALIRGVSDAPDAVPDALLQLTLGNEEALFDAAMDALNATKDAPAGISDALAKFAAALFPRLEVLETNLDPRVRAHLTAGDSTLGLAGILYELFQEISTRKRVCVAPGCGASVSGRFVRCSDCGVAVYCSKSCQRRDWNRDSVVAHKVVCPLLRKIFAVADLSMSRYAFERAVVGAYQWSYPESETMAHFAISHDCLPMRFQVRAMQIHVAIWAVMGVPVNKFRAVLQNPEFRAAMHVMSRQENWAAGA